MKIPIFESQNVNKFFRHINDALIWAVRHGNTFTKSVNQKYVLMNSVPLMKTIIQRVKVAKQTMIEGIGKVETQVEEWSSGNRAFDPQVTALGKSYEFLTENIELSRNISGDDIASMCVLAFLIRLCTITDIKDLNKSAVVEQQFTRMTMRIQPVGALHHRAFANKMRKLTLRKHAAAEAITANKTGITTH